ncbi:MAG: DnaJ C-terminal domain-containing protein [Bifidobacterium dentium]
MDLPITVGQAVAGAKVTARISTATKSPSVPAGSSSGTEVRISGRGVANRQGDGDLIGRVQIRIPDKPSLSVKHAAKEFDKSGDFADEGER